ncbi:MAG: ABC transporter ATP-binding protein [Erysipelotrichaceae bacterium]
MLAAFMIAICDIFYPVISRNMLNIYIPQQKLNIVMILCLVLLCIYICKMCLNYFVQYYGHNIGVYMQADMRKQVFVKLQKLPFSYYDENETGTIMSKIINDLMDISELAHHGPEDLFISLVLMIGSFIYLCTVNLHLTIIIFAFIPILIIFAIKMKNRMSLAFKESRKEIGKVNSTLENSISGIRVAKAFTNAKHETTKFQKGNQAFVNAKVKAYKIMAQFYSGTGFITDILNVAVLLVGGIYTFNGIISVGDLIAYMLFINMFVNPIKKLINFMEQYQNGMSGFQRYIKLMDEPIEEQSLNAKALDKPQGNIKFDHVNFSYNKDKLILKNINLDIKAGSNIALVGPSGGGKTTICHLIPSFYKLDKGSIMIDGQPIEDITFESLRENIGIVQQDVFLFSGTIKDNIAYGKLNCNDKDIVEAAKKANIHNYIMSLEEGYETQIGERGVKLSGGQKQRISIARVFLKNPKILILDEATSALDNTSELLIQKSLDDLRYGRTTIIVAHRLSTIKNADYIAVINDGSVKEYGTHKSLIDLNGMYKKLYDAQFIEINN